MIIFNERDLCKNIKLKNNYTFYIINVMFSKFLPFI